MPGSQITKYRRRRRYFRKIPLYRTKTNFTGVHYHQVNLQLVCYRKNKSNGDQGDGFTLGNTGLTSEGPNYVVMNGLRDNAEYAKFKAMYNYVKMLGITIHTVPSYRNVAGNDNSAAFKGYVNLFYAENNYDQVDSLAPMALDAFSAQKVFIKRQNREWIDSDITIAQATATQNFGFLVVRDNDKTVLQTYCPWWNVYVKIFLAFKGTRV